MTRNQRRWSLSIAVLGLVLLFQNCGSNQNFDLQQAAQRASGEPEAPAAPDLAAPTPVPTPPPPRTGLATKGQYCARAAAEMPKFRVSVSDLREQNLAAAAGLESFFRAELRLRDLNLYLPQLDLRALPLDAGYDLGGGGALRRDDGTELRGDFGVLYETHLQLDQETAGYYQIAVAASGQVELEIQDGDGSYVKRLAALDGVDDTRFLCAAKNLDLRRGEQLGLRLRQTHGRAPTLSASLYWRKVGSESAAPSASCGAAGELFRAGQPTAALQTILNEGWQRPGAGNLTLIPDGPNLVRNGDFEDVKGLTLPTTPNWYAILPSLPSWSTYVKFELQKTGFTGVHSYRGGQYWIELDADPGLDAILQPVAVRPGAKYRHLFDYATPTDTAQSTAQIQVYRVDSSVTGQWKYEALDTVSAPNNGQWRTYQRSIEAGAATQLHVKLQEAGGDDRQGAYVDNVVLREIRENDAVCTGGLPDAGLKIISASYGRTKFADAAAFARGRCEGRTECAFTVNNEMNGDPEYGVGKTLTVRYSCLNGETTVQAPENQTIRLACP